MKTLTVAFDLPSRCHQLYPSYWFSAHGRSAALTMSHPLLLSGLSQFLPSKTTQYPHRASSTWWSYSYICWLALAMLNFNGCVSYPSLLLHITYSSAKDSLITHLITPWMVQHTNSCCRRILCCIAELRSSVIVLKAFFTCNRTHQH